MTGRGDDDQGRTGKAGARPDDPRAARLKAALKANLARRKAQARARDDDAGPSGATGQGEASGKGEG